MSEKERGQFRLRQCLGYVKTTRMVVEGAMNGTGTGSQRVRANDALPDLLYAGCSRILA